MKGYKNVSVCFQCPLKDSSPESAGQTIEKNLIGQLKLQ